MSSQSSAPTTAPSPAPVRAKKTNRARTKARAQFDASAPTISLERFFTEFQEIKRSNVDIELDDNLLDRVASPYVDKASDYADIADLDPDTVKPNLQRVTYALVGMTYVRKLIKSAPASIKPTISPINYVSDIELYSPPSLCAVFENVGKVSTDDFTLRLKYHEQDIIRNIFRILKTMSTHTNFADRYAAPVGTTWENLDPESIILASRGSARWLGDLGKTFLSETVYQNFPAVVDIGGQPVEVQVTFPQLRIVANRDAMLRNIVAWLGNLHQALPNVHLLVAAAIFLIVTPQMLERPNTRMDHLEPAFRDLWIGNNTLQFYLNLANIHIVTFRTRDVARNNWFNFFQDVHSFITSSGRTIFDKFLKLTKQPDTQFGTTAQMLEMDSQAWIRTESRTVAGVHHSTQRQDMSARSLVKLSDKGSVTTGLTFGFAKTVTYNNAYSARLNGNPTAIRLQYVATDFLNIG